MVIEPVCGTVISNKLSAIAAGLLILACIICDPLKNGIIKNIIFIVFPALPARNNAYQQGLLVDF